ncbi:MAG TPA: LamG domain-containing protein, partial [Thermoguttaceae bacterium]|nr:LamG domain-containing protein [Thermoguttaceae bacterium]
RIFDFGRSDGGEGISDSGGSQKFIMITPKSSSSQMELHYRNGTSTTAITRPTMPANDKAHVAVVWDGQASVVRFYVNGALVGVNATNMALTDLIDVNNWLGRSQYGADPLFAGGYDEFRIYNKALSSFELGQSRLMGPEMPEANAKNAAYVADGGPVHYIPINLADAVGTSNINYNHPVLPSGQQTLGGVPFDIVNVNGNDSWNAYYATGSNRQLEIPINRGAITEANLLLGTFWGEQTAGTYASILFKATTGEEFVVQLDGNSDIRDYNQGSSANTINNITTTMVLQNGTQRVDMLKVILPDSWRWLTLESITIRDFGANGSGSDNFQRIFLSGLTLGTVPEPATVVLLALGGLALGGLAWRKNRRQEKVCS